jgi:hypothetical protein
MSFDLLYGLLSLILFSPEPEKAEGRWAEHVAFSPSFHCPSVASPTYQMFVACHISALAVQSDAQGADGGDQDLLPAMIDCIGRMAVFIRLNIHAELHILRLTGTGRSKQSRGSLRNRINKGSNTDGLRGCLLYTHLTVNLRGHSNIPNHPKYVGFDPKHRRVCSWTQYTHFLVHFQLENPMNRTGMQNDVQRPPSRSISHRTTVAQVNHSSGDQA